MLTLFNISLCMKIKLVQLKTISHFSFDTKENIKQRSLTPQQETFQTWYNPTGSNGAFQEGPLNQFYQCGNRKTTDLVNNKLFTMKMLTMWTLDPCGTWGPLRFKF